MMTDFTFALYFAVFYLTRRGNDVAGVYIQSVYMYRHAGFTKSGTPKLAKARKPPKLQLFKITFKPWRASKNSEIKTCL